MSKRRDNLILARDIMREKLVSGLRSIASDLKAGDVTDDNLYAEVERVVRIFRFYSINGALINEVETNEIVEAEKAQ